jgi:hypothetical protein
VSGTFNAGPNTNRLPPTVPADCGAKATLKVTLCPTANAKGNVGPLTENAAPVACTAEIVIFDVRAFVITTGSVPLAPIITCPKESIAGLAVTGSLFTPIPPRFTSKLGFDALLENLTVPPVHPVAAGVKLTLTLKLPPAGRTSGKLSLDTANTRLLTVISVTVTLVVPAFVTVTIDVSV